MENGIKMYLAYFSFHIYNGNTTLKKGDKLKKKIKVNKLPTGVHYIKIKFKQGK